MVSRFITQNVQGRYTCSNGHVIGAELRHSSKEVTLPRIAIILYSLAIDKAKVASDFASL